MSRIRWPVRQGHASLKALIGGFTFVFILVYAPHIQSKELVSKTKVFIYSQGREIPLSQEGHYAKSISDECESILLGADSVLRLAIDPEYIRKIKRQGYAVEVVYDNQHEVQIANLRRQISLSRILIPLEGELAGEVATVFFGDGGYKSGPFRNSVGTASLAAKVGSAGEIR